jgi:sarcosine oxidase subunit beta
MSGHGIVIGGGLHGLSTALHLARLGWRVTLLERRHVGRHSSGINAGGVRRLGRDVAEIGLSQVSAEMWARIVELVGDDCGFRATGQVKVAESAADMAKLAARQKLVRELGWDFEELVDGDEVRRLLPGIAAHVVGALVVRDDGAADPMRTVMAFRRAAVAAGVDLREGVGVLGIARQGAAIVVRTDAGEITGDRVANCAGAWAADFARMLGDDIPCGVKASMMIVTERLPAFLAPTVGATARALSFKQTDAGTVLIGGGMQGHCDPAAERSLVDFRNLARSARTASELFPCMLGVRIVRTWSGIEAKPPDEIPVIGESPGFPGVVHSFGYSGHGFQLAPAAGAAVAQLMARGETNLPITGLAPTRFARRQAA